MNPSLRAVLVATAVTLGHAPFHPAAAQAVRRTLGADTASWIALSGQLRLRGENWSDFPVAGPDRDDSFGLARLMVRGEARVAGLLGLMVELRSSHAGRRTLAGGVRLADEDFLDVQQAWGEIAGAVGRGRVALRAGRFDLGLGRERLVGASDWTNTRRAFQGAHVRLTRARGDVTAFLVRPVAVRRRTPNIADSTKQLYGVVASRTAAGLTRQVYWLRSEARSATFNGTTGYERRHTLGARWARGPAASRFDADVEAAVQLGTVGAEDARAWMAAVTGGRSFAGPRALRLYAGVEAASGDAGAGGAVQTFNQLFPTGHAHLGFADVHGRQNVVALMAGASFRVRALAVQLDLWDFRRASTTDGAYDATGALIRPAGAGLPAHVGSEVDLTLRYPLARGRVVLQGGLSRYLAGSFLNAGAPGGDPTLAYAQATASW
jgi:hypothetical protein